MWVKAKGSTDGGRGSASLSNIHLATFIDEWEQSTGKSRYRPEATSISAYCEAFRCR